jgi:glyoxylase-like metal-dependent hydrolase (beta-lactamase superfamily II)
MPGMEDLPTGKVEQIAPGVRRLLAGNPSPFTYTGTQTYIVGARELGGEVAVIDPGPDLPEHVDAILAATQGERITAILCTHTHRDHSPASRPLASATGAPIVGCARSRSTMTAPAPTPRSISIMRRTGCSPTARRWRGRAGG